MRAGKLRHSITVEQVSEVRDARGETTKTWSTFLTSRAGIYPLRGKEFFAAHQDNAEINTKIVLRYQPGITAEMRVLANGNYYDIQAVINVEERNRELNLMCMDRFGGKA